MQGSRPQVVIVGAGFGGLEAATALAHAPVDVVVIDQQNHHCFQPLLYQVATAALSPADVAWPIRSMLHRQENVRVIMARVTRRRSRRTLRPYRLDQRQIRLPGPRDRGDAFLFRPRANGLRSPPA